MKAFIFDPLWNKVVTPDLIEKLETNKIETQIITGIAPLEKCSELFETDGEKVLCLNPDYVGWKVNTSDYEKIPNLKAILTESTSFAWIDTSFADENNIAICNIKGFSTQAVAEWAITMMFNLARQIPRLIKDDFPLDFDKDYMEYRGVELHGKTAGIIGLGNIGNAIARRCKALGMNVIYWSQSSKDNEFEAHDLTSVFENADVIFPTMALNEVSKALITNEMLDSMKSDSMLVSIDHHLFDYKYAIELAQQQKIFGFAFEDAPKSFSNYKGNVWAAPAYAWATKETMHNALIHLVDNIVRASNGEFPNRVN